MSDAVSPISGALFEGYATIRDGGLCGMITVRGDFAAKPFAAAVSGLAGVDFPERGSIALDQGNGLAWMSPDELLLFCPYSDAPDKTAELAKALGKHHHLVANVSDARAVFTITGPVREVLGKLSPTDLSTNSLAVGQFRRSRLAQVAAAFWMESEDQATVVTLRSVSEYAFGVLKRASMPGSEVDLSA